MACLILTDLGFGARVASYESHLIAQMMGEATLLSEGSHQSMAGLQHFPVQRAAQSHEIRALVALLRCFNLATASQSVGAHNIVSPATRAVCTSLSMVSTSDSNPSPKTTLSELDGPIDVPVHIPKFRWDMVWSNALSSMLLIPIALLIKSLFKLEWLGPNFAVSAGAAGMGLLLGALLHFGIALSEFLPATTEQAVESSPSGPRLPVEEAVASPPSGPRLPVQEDVVSSPSVTCSPAEEAVVSSLIYTLYSMGGKFVPIRAAIGATLMAASTATGEELLYRGCFQTCATNIFAWISVPMGLATQLAVLSQAIIFGANHDDTPNLAYKVLSAMSGILLGAAFAVTGNILVPIIGHFINNVVSLFSSHVSMSKLTEDEQRRILLVDLPIAAQMRRAYHYG